ncbi:MAG: shikimate kinase [Propionibacteriaceae bacterium]|nr:shikimate kinase [Propionibacteriaceae bacterium]
MSLVLVGLPASGKSSVGALVARRLGLPHVDTDEFIEQQAGRAIADIFAEDGEAAFRALETAALRATLAVPDTVVSVGGGAVIAPENRALLAGHEVVWLDVTVATATRRAGLAKLRPLLLGDVRRQLEVLNAERRPLYEAVATHRIDANRLNQRQAATAVLCVTGRLEGDDHD